jgi:hypothetical protein
MRNPTTAIDPSVLRKIARAAGLGRLKLRFNLIRATGLAAGVETIAAKARYLRRILHARPLDVSCGQLELRMLLHKKRFLEGLWSLYSFVYFARTPIKLAVHSDGSLDENCIATLKCLLQGCEVISRQTADEEVSAFLAKQHLRNCLEWRRRNIHSLKAIDLLYYSSGNRYCVLDSDVLTFKHQQDLLNGFNDLHKYSIDCNDHSYCFDRQELERRMGAPILSRLNSGLLLVERSGLSLDSFEETLGRTRLLTDPTARFYYSEQTVYACSLARRGAVGLDADAYTICGDPNTVTTGHYCGFGYWATRFYREGLPVLSRRIGIDG